jgi:hypothetical protein
MWMFISARLRSWLIFAVAMPVATTAVHMLRERLEARSGRTRWLPSSARSRTLEGARSAVAKYVP